MAQARITCETERGRLAFRTETGFSLEGGKCSLGTDRGASNPLAAGGGKLGMEHQFHVRQLSAKAVEFWQTMRNTRSETLGVKDIRVFDGKLKLDGAGWRVMHSELFKRDRVCEGYNHYTEGLLAPIPGTAGEFGLSEDSPFPGILFTHPERGTALMAVLSQERCKPCWTLRPEGRHTSVEATERFYGVPSIPVAEGQEIETERWVLLHVRGGVEEAIDEYYRLLRKRIAFHGETSILREAVVWGSWNYNDRTRGHADVNEDWVVANARELAKLVTGKPVFAMIDDGYQVDRSTRKTQENWFSSDLEIFHDDGRPPHDPALFPNGMKGAADAIRAAGVNPAIWMSPRIRTDCSLAKDRPEWLLQTEDGKGFGGTRSAYLDYSLPEVRAYTRNAWRTAIEEWGFQAIKLDFWTLPFEIATVQYRNQDKTAIELRNLFLSDIREFIPEDGYFITCVVVNGGNPFIGRYADASRMGMDIGSGPWKTLLECSRWLTAVAPFYRHDCLLGDPDSIGWCPRNTAGENRLWATMALLSGGLCEIAGDLTTLPQEGRDLLRTVADTFGPRLRTLNGIADGSLGNLPPRRLVLEDEAGQFEAYLNWTGETRKIRVSKPGRDLWTGAEIAGEHMLPPRDAVCLRR